jgi:hypothetical protein
MIDSIMSLTLTMSSNKGVYALLIGSGVSRSSGLPTGHEITLDIIRKLAKLSSVECEPDPEKWYLEKHGKAPMYDDLLNDVAKTKAERNALLKQYFEPTEKEQEEGLKRPTKAHKAIAKLVLKGYIKIIITTNFDRLLEQALEEIGVVPIVISTSDAIKGMPPLTHNKCTIIKVNGDYLDLRIKNTEKELSVYNKTLNSLLDQVFDEYGLIICGWSGNWDTALKAAIERNKNYRYATYWTTRGSMSEEAKKNANSKKAQIIGITNADEFFSEVYEKCDAINRLSKENPISVEMTAAVIKKYLSEKKYQIELHDLIVKESKRVQKLILPEKFPTPAGSAQKTEFLERMEKYENITEVFRTIISICVYHGDQENDFILIESIGRIASLPVQDGNSALINLSLYPGLILLHTAGIACVAKKRYDLLTKLLTHNRRKNGVEDSPLLYDLFTGRVVGSELQKWIDPGRLTPLSERLCSVLRNCFDEIVPDDKTYIEMFDRYEYLFALLYADIRNKNWGPEGCFVWRNMRRIKDKIENELEKEKHAWPLLKLGYFEGRTQKIKEIMNQLANVFGQLGWEDIQDDQ